MWGNFLMAAEILLIICFHLLYKENLIIIYLQHPLKSIS